jgi:hypothetical protein
MNSGKIGEWLRVPVVRNSALASRSIGLARVGAVAALFLCHFILANQAHAATPADIATTRTNVLNYLTNLKNQPTNKVLSGQHAGDSLPTLNPFSAQSGYASYITALQTSTGKLVAIAGAGYDALSPTIRPLSEMLSVNTVLKAHWNSGGLVEIGFATHNPWTGGQCGDTNTAGHTLTDVATPGTAANIIFVRQLDDFATALADLEASGVVVLARPFHEFNGNWFWWGAAANGQDYINLWRYMHDYLTITKGLKNLIWVWAGSGGSTNPLAQYYPGSAYVDIVGIDLYKDTFTANAINAYNTLSTYGKPFALAEYGPDTNTTATTGTLDWTTFATQIKTSMPNVCYFKAWADYIGPAGNRYWSLKSNKNAAQLLADPWVVTADELPNFAATAQTGSLTATISPAGVVTAGAQWNVDGGAWQASGAIVPNLTAGSHTVSFSAVTGYTSPADQTVTITAGQTTTATGTYATNGYTLTVTATAGTGGTVAPPSQSVTSGSTTTFTVTADMGYTRDASVGGTCPAGFWNLTTYTTGTITGACSVSFTFALKSATPAAPAAVTDSPANIAEKAVTFNGSVNPNGLSTTVIFQYGKTTLYGLNTPSVPLVGRLTKAVSANVTGLACGTTYHFRVNAANAKGTTKGSDVTFATSACTTPMATTGAVTNKTQKTVTLNGTINPRNATTTVKFQYGKTTMYGLTTSIVTLTGATDQAVMADVAGLICGTTYHFRVWAQNPSGTIWGPDVPFKTSACLPPTAATGVATGLTSTGVTLSGTVNPKNDTTTVKFQYGTTNLYGLKSSSGTLTGSTDQAMSADLTGLICGTVYHFRAWAKNSRGAARGTDATFTTLACPDPAPDLNTPVSPVSDFNGDGKSDILLRDAVSGQTATWMMNGANVTSNLATSMNAGSFTSTSGWQAQGLGDFDGDGKNDLLWRDSATGELAVWTMNGATVVTSATASVNPGAYTATTGWQVQGIGDFNGDGKSDILFRDTVSGETSVWFMNGAVVTSNANTNVQATAGWHVNGVGDFNGDGRADILWRRAGTGKTAIWFMNGASKTGGGYTNVQPGAYTSTTGWQVQGAGDFNGDGKSDILLRDAETGRMAIWMMNGVKVVSSAYTSVDAGSYTSTVGLQVSAIGDYNGDGKADILLRDAETGQTRVWVMNGSQVTSDVATDVNPGAYTPSTGWSVVSEETVR